MALINPKSCVTRALFGFVKLRPPAMAPRVAKRAFSVRGYDSPVPRPCASRVATCNLHQERDPTQTLGCCLEQ